MPAHGKARHPGVPDTITPHIVVRDAARAIDFYRRAFGAEELLRLNDAEGRIVHAELRFGRALLYLNEESPEDDALAPESLGGAAASLQIFVDDVDATYARAVSSGATPKTRVADMFWGERYGTLVDPFGHEWAIATRIEALSSEEVRARANQAVIAAGAAAPEGRAAHL